MVTWSQLTAAFKFLHPNCFCLVASYVHCTMHAWVIKQGGILTLLFLVLRDSQETLGELTAERKAQLEKENIAR